MEHGRRLGRPGQPDLSLLNSGLLQTSSLYLFSIMVHASQGRFPHYASFLEYLCFPVPFSFFSLKKDGCGLIGNWEKWKRNWIKRDDKCKNYLWEYTLAKVTLLNQYIYSWKFIVSRYIPQIITKGKFVHILSFAIFVWILK